MPLRKYQQDAVDELFGYWEKSSRPCILQLATGCHEAFHKILMADGSVKRADEIQVGDYLMGRNCPTKVIELHRGSQEMFRVVPVKGEPFVVNAGHILHVLHYFRHNEGGKRVWERRELDISVKDYLVQSKTWKHCTKLMYGGYDYGKNPNVEHFEPYLIGAYLGDGQVFSEKYRQSIITNVDIPVIEKCRRIIEKQGWEFKNLSDSKDWSIKSGGEFKQMLFEVGAMNKDEFQRQFPNGALSWTAEARAELLAGFLDTDGSKSRNVIDFIQKNKQIAVGVARLAKSLGIMATVSKSYKSCQTFKGKRLYWRVCISGKGLDSLPMVKHSVSPNRQKKNQLLTGFSVESCGDGKYYGWEVDAEDHLYFDGNLMLHHNSGKSHIIADIVSKMETPTLILQPTKEILEQNLEKLNAVGVYPQICSASAGDWKIGDVTLATIGTIRKWAEYCQRFKVIVVDEADCIPVNDANSMYMKFFNALPNAEIVGLTATPFRNQTFQRMYEDPRVYCRPVTRIHTNGGKDTFYGEWFWNKIIYRCSIADLQELGYLSKTQYYVAPTDWSFIEDVPGRVEYEMEQMTQWVDVEENTSTFTRAIKWCMENNLKTIVFSPNINMNFQLNNVITSLGGKSSTLDSAYDNRKTREAKMNALRSGEIQFLVNVGMVGRGVDVPSVDCVLWTRPTKSLSFWMQGVGRCLRIDPNNPNKTAYIVDLTDNYERFGKAEDITIEKIDAISKTGRPYKQDAIIVKRNGRKRVWDRVS